MQFKRRSRSLATDLGAPLIRPPDHQHRRRLLTRRLLTLRLLNRSLCCAGLLWAPTCWAAGSHGVHVHGDSSLEMVIDAGAVFATLRGPAANFYGFERAPRNQQERAAIAEARRMLEAPARLIEWDEETGCELTAAQADLPWDPGEGAPTENVAGEAGHAADHHEGDHADHREGNGQHAEERHDHHDEHEEEQHEEEQHEAEQHEEEQHGEVVANWTWTCAEVVEPDQVTIRLIEAFPATETVALTVLAADGTARTAKLRAGDQRIP